MADAMDRASDVSREIVESLHERLKAVGNKRRDRIQRKVGRYWIAIRSTKQDRVFAEIRPHGTGLEVFILPGPEDLSDPSRLARRAPSSQGWGWFRSRFEVRTQSEAGPAFHLLRQSYLHAVAGPNGRAGRRRRRRTQTV